MAHLSLLSSKRYVVYVFQVLLTWLCVFTCITHSAAESSACEVRYIDAPPPSPPNFVKVGQTTNVDR